MSKIIRQEVKTFISNLVCEKCNEGFMQKDTTGTATVLMSNPPKFKHVCTKCEREDWYVQQYPALTYEYVDTIPS